MAGSYTLPQVKVFQEFNQTPNDVTQNLNPFVIGPNYQLIRYSESGERGDCTTDTYKGSASLDLDWATGITGSIPDLNKYGVTFENAYVALGGSDLPVACLDAATGAYGTKFEFTLEEGSLVGKDAVFGTPVRAGDYLYYTEGSGASAKQKYAKIKSISCGKLSESEISSDVTKKDGTAFTKLDVKTSDYIGEKDVTVNLTLKVTGATTKTFKATWSSTLAGIKSTDEKTIGTADYTDLGKGLKVKADAELAAGEYVLVITVKLGTSYQLDTVTVAENVLVSAGMTFTFIRRLDVVDVDSEYLSVGTDGVTVNAGVKVLIDGTEFLVNEAKAYLNQRNFLTTHTKGVYSLRTDADIIRELGAITPDNPLAYGAHIMRMNCATATIKYIAIESDTLEGWTKAIDRSSVTTEVYAFCPLTEDREIIDAVVTHCNEMSTEENKSWRISFFSMPTERDRDITPINESGVKEQCTVAKSGTVVTLTCRPRGGTTTAESDYAKFNDTVSIGDTVIVTNTNKEKVTTTVKAITGKTTLTLEDDVSDASTALCNFSIVHTLEQAEYVDAIATTSKGFYNHRAYNVWPNRLKADNGEFVSGMFGAAAVCGLACSVAPQQPITNVELNGFTDIPATYSDYNRDELNTIASGGTLIIMQEKMNGTVYVRHQISTKYSSGNLNETELSLIKNLDSISYYFSNRFAPYIGRYNVTDDLLTELRSILTDGLAHLQTATETNRLVGPQVLVDGTEIRSLYRDPDQKDHIYSYVALNLPAPFNNFDLHLQVI